MIFTGYNTAMIQARCSMRKSRHGKAIPFFRACAADGFNGSREIRTQCLSGQPCHPWQHFVSVHKEAKVSKGCFVMAVDHFSNEHRATIPTTEAFVSIYFEALQIIYFIYKMR